MEVAIDKRIKVLEDESKLVKTELKTTVTNIRDLLVGLKTPPREAVDFRSEGQEEADKPAPPKPRATLSQELAGAVEDFGEAPPLDDVPPPQESSLSEMAASATPAPKPGKPAAPEPKTPKNELPEGKRGDEDHGDSADNREKATATVRSRTSPCINPLVNLIGWVSNAKRAIGKEQLATLLDVYEIGGELPAEVRAVILRLADVIDEGAAGSCSPSVSDQLADFLEICQGSGQISNEVKEAILRLTDRITLPAPDAPARLWSQLVLELHAIVSGNEAIFQGKKLSWLDKRNVPEAACFGNGLDKVVKLKLVFPGNNGSGSQEYAVNLQPEAVEEALEN